VVGFETAFYKSSTKHYKENQPWNTFGCTIPVIFRWSTGRALRGNFPTGMEQRGQLGRTDRAGQYESGEKR